MGVSKNSGTPKSSILIGFSIINHPFWGTPIFGNIHIVISHIMLNVCAFEKNTLLSIGDVPVTPVLLNQDRDKVTGGNWGPSNFRKTK